METPCGRELRETIKCSKCKILKNINEYYNNVASRNGLCNYCKSCKYEVYKETKDRFFPKITCECGKTIYKCYLPKHLNTKLHSSKFKQIAV